MTSSVENKNVPRLVWDLQATGKKPVGEGQSSPVSLETPEPPNPSVITTFEIPTEFRDAKTFYDSENEKFCMLDDPQKCVTPKLEEVNPTFLNPDERALALMHELPPHCKEEQCVFQSATPYEYTPVIRDGRVYNPILQVVAELKKYRVSATKAWAIARAMAEGSPVPDHVDLSFIFKRDGVDKFWDLVNFLRGGREARAHHLISRLKAHGLGNVALFKNFKEDPLGFVRATVEASSANSSGELPPDVRVAWLVVNKLHEANNDFLAHSNRVAQASDDPSMADMLVFLPALSLLRQDISNPMVAELYGIVDVLEQTLTFGKLGPQEHSTLSQIVNFLNHHEFDNNVETRNARARLDAHTPQATRRQDLLFIARRTREALRDHQPGVSRHPLDTRLKEILYAADDIEGGWNLGRSPSATPRLLPRTLAAPGRTPRTTLRPGPSLPRGKPGMAIGGAAILTGALTAFSLYEWLQWEKSTPDE